MDMAVARAPAGCRHPSSSGTAETPSQPRPTQPPLAHLGPSHRKRRSTGDARTPSLRSPCPKAGARCRAAAGCQAAAVAVGHPGRPTPASRRAGRWGSHCVPADGKEETKLVAHGPGGAPTQPLVGGTHSRHQPSSPPPPPTANTAPPAVPVQAAGRPRRVVSADPPRPPPHRNNAAATDSPTSRLGRRCHGRVEGGPPVACVLPLCMKATHSWGKG